MRCVIKDLFLQPKVFFMLMVICLYPLVQTMQACPPPPPPPPDLSALAGAGAGAGGGGGPGGGGSGEPR